uniref:GED domain-containing protein n=1 Tax=Fagus sylvatica TaxID=28930 RepID=A0A2N9G2Y8_FAGSY
MARQLQEEESGLFQPTQPAPPSPGTDSVDRDERALEGPWPSNAAPALVPQREREELARSIHRAVGESFNVPVLNKGSSTLHQHEEEYSLELPEQNAPIICIPTMTLVTNRQASPASFESLAGINLPRGLGICTRVPLIMRLQHQPLPQPELVLKFNEKVVKTDEEHVSEAINRATDEIAGLGCQYMDQPEDIYDQIRKIIMEDVTDGGQDGERTLAVVTKSDKAPEGLLEKVTADDVNIGLGYIDKSMVGVPVLAQKLVQIQAESIAKNLPEIVKSINEKLNLNVAELKGMPKKMSSLSEAMTVFMQIIGSAKESLRKILLRGEFDEYPDEKKMHCTARLVEMLNHYSVELHRNAESNPAKNFLMEEIMVLEETKGIWLPNFLPHTAFLTVLQRKVNGISSIPISFAKKVWNYVEEVVISVIMDHSVNYPQLQLSFRRAGQNLIAKMKERSVDWVMEIVEMEKLTDYTCNPEYLSDWNKRMSYQHSFLKAVLPAEEWPSIPMAVPPSLSKVGIPEQKCPSIGLRCENRPSFSNLYLEGFGEIEVKKIRQYPHFHPHVLQQAFDMKMRMTAYWKIVLRRLVDCMALHLQLSVSKLVNKELEEEIVAELMGAGGGIERMLDESPSVDAKRLKINKSIELLQKSKEVVAKIMD